MNPDTRQFEPIPAELPADDHRRDWPKFHVGQQVHIGGWLFQIRKITKKDLVLRPLRPA